MASTPFGTIVTADQQIVTSRTMSWDRSGYGTHQGSGVSTPRTAWYIAEGATLPRFSLYYLLQNPGDTAANVTVRYLPQASEAYRSSGPTSWRREAGTRSACTTTRPS